MTAREEMAVLTRELAGLAAKLEGPLALMEVCGTHTVNAFRGGIHSLKLEILNVFSHLKGLNLLSWNNILILITKII